MDLSNKTFLPIKDHKKRNWFLIDCKGQSLGRLATTVVKILKGKTKPYFYPSIDVGDSIILINANKIIVNKNAKHFLVYNPGRPGSSLKIKSVSTCLPELTIEKAIKGMLPKTKTKRILKRLSIYNGTDHPHQAQKPLEVEVLDSIRL